MANRPAVLIVDLSPVIQRMLCDQLRSYAPGTPVYITGILSSADRLLSLYPDIRVVAIGSLSKGGQIVDRSTLGFIARTASLKMPSCSMKVIGATTILASAELMLSAGCEDPIVTNKKDWYVRVVAALGLTAGIPDST